MNLADRMKLYEKQSTNITFLSKLPILIRLDGSNFSKFTKSLAKPFDERLSKLMIETAKYLAELTNSKMAFVGSDEITLLLYSDDIKSETFLNRRKFKLESILAAKCSVYFNSKLPSMLPEKIEELPVFDCRAWVVPTLEEATNVFLWRERDITKNAITMAALSIDGISNNVIEGMNGSKKQDLMMEKYGINFNNYPSFFKRGTYIQKRTEKKKLSFDEINKLPEKHFAKQNPNLEIERSFFKILEMPIFDKIDNKVEVVFYGEEPKVKTI